MILRMSGPDHEKLELTAVLTALHEHLQMLTELNRKLLEVQKESSALLREFSGVVHQAFSESVKMQAEVGETILKSNAALAQTLDEIAQKLGVAPTAFPSATPPPSKKGNGTIQ
jgi:hypothetical protein